MNRGFPLMTITFTLVSILWFTHMGLSYHMINEDFDFGITSGFDPYFSYENGGIYGAEFTSDEWWRLITPVFLHAHMLHLVLNMLFLLTLGPKIEYLIGRIRFFVLYLMSGITGNLAVVVYEPNVVAVGASTALYGLVGFLFSHYFIKRSDNLYSEGRYIFWFIVIMTIITNYYDGEFGLVSDEIGNMKISLAGHAGGLIAGIILGLFINEIETKRTRNSVISGRKPNRRVRVFKRNNTKISDAEITDEVGDKQLKLEKKSNINKSETGKESDRTNDSVISGRKPEQRVIRAWKRKNTKISDAETTDEVVGKQPEFEKESNINKSETGKESNRTNDSVISGRKPNRRIRIFKRKNTKK